MSADSNHETASQIPPRIRFGTSTWTYPGWKNLVYHKTYKSERQFKQDSLAEYWCYPWFRTVGIDNTFYRPATPKLLEEYLGHTPEGSLWVSKVWERLTIPVYPQHPRYGKNAGNTNSDFLNPSLFINEVASAFEPESIKSRTGPFIFQFPSVNAQLRRELGLIDRIHRFLDALPKDLRYAVEIRNRELLKPEYFAALNSTGATHCFNHWSYMPSLRAQMEAAATAEGLKAPFFVARLLTPRGVSYQKAVDRFRPYASLQEPNPEMRADAVTLIKRALKRDIDAFVLVNNRSEGCAPLTIAAIGEMVYAEMINAAAP